MSDDQATAHYLAEVASRPVPEPQTQLAWTRAIDAAQQAFNRALLDCPAARTQFVRLTAQVRATDVTPRWLARRVGSAEEAEMPVEVEQLHGQTPDRLPAALAPLRLRSEFMAEVCAAVRAGDAEGAEAQVFLAAAGAAQTQIRAATDRLVQANQRLVVTLARQYRYAPMAFMDLVQEGNLGLLRAIERFDPGYGARVSTYALWWVRRAMVYAIARQGHAVRPPVQQYWSARQIQRTLSRLDGTRGCRHPLREAARELGISVTAIQEGLALLAPAAALDAPLEGSDGLGRIERLVAVDDAGDPEGSASERDLRRAVCALLAHLPERHAKILRMRFGIDVYDHCTLEQIAQQQGVTRERIRQLEAQALDALRALDAAWVLRGCLS